MQTLWDRLNGRLTDPAQLRDALLDLVPSLVDQYGDIAAKAAADWYNAARAEQQFDDGFIATLDGTHNFPSAAIQDSIRWKAGVLWDKTHEHPDGDRNALAVFLNDAVDRWVHYSGRNTIEVNTRRDPRARGFALVPGGKCCSWCAMLASRGFAYRTADTAKASTHSHCDCEAIPGWGSNPAKMAILSGYDPNHYYDIYKSAREKLEQMEKLSVQTSPEAERTRKVMTKWLGKPFGPILNKRGLDGLDDDVRDKAISVMMSCLEPNEFTDGRHLDSKQIDDLTLSTWNDFRSSLAERFIEADDSRHRKIVPVKPAQVPADWPTDIPRLTTRGWNHILYGEKRKEPANPKKGRRTGEYLNYQGGHLWGYGWVSGGDQFPASWDANTIANAARELLSRGESNKAGIYRGEYHGVKFYVAVSKRKSGCYIRTITPIGSR